MNVAMLQNEIQQLPAELQDRLAAFLTVLRMRRSGQDEEIFRRLDDPLSEKWLSWQQAKKELDEDPAAE